MTPTPKPIRCWAVYSKTIKCVLRLTDYEPKYPDGTPSGITIIPGRFVPDKPKKRKRK